MALSTHLSRGMFVMSVWLCNLAARTSTQKTQSEGLIILICFIGFDYSSWEAVSLLFFYLRNYQRVHPVTLSVVSRVCISPRCAESVIA